MRQSLLSDDRENYIFGSIVRGATKLAKSAGESLLSKAEQAVITNSKQYKNLIKELTTDNAQGAGVTYNKAEIKEWEKLDGVDEGSLEQLEELLSQKLRQDKYANELIDAGVKPSSVKRILSSDFTDKDLTEGERSIRNKFLDKYFPKDPDAEIDVLMDERRQPILIEHRAGKEPKAEGGAMSQSLLSDKDLSFPNTQVTKTMDSTSRTQESPGAAPDMGFPGGGSGVRQPYIFGSLAKLGTKAARSLLADATKEVKKAQKNLPKGKELKDIEDYVEEWGGGDTHGDLFTPDQENRMRIRDLEFEMSQVPALAKAITNLRSKIYKDYKNIEVANRVYIGELEKIENKYLEEGKNIQWNAQERGMQEAQDYDAMMREGGPESLSEYRARKPEYYKEMPPTENFEDLEDFLERQKPASELDFEEFRPGEKDPRFEEFIGQDELDRLSKPLTAKQRRKILEEAEAAKKEKPPFNTGGRVKKQEGSLMVPPEMESDMPVDTYPNIPPEEMDEAMASQLPDAEMEDKYTEFVLDQSLDDEEQDYLMNALEADPKLSQIFDKVVTAASEFTGAGEVEGPGTGVSDSIPARLSDGEFVFTKKATDQMGADNLQMMMDDAERAFDGGQMRSSKQDGGLMYKQKDEDPLAYEKIAQDEIKKNMLRSNRAPSLLGGN